MMTLCVQVSWYSSQVSHIRSVFATFDYLNSTKVDLVLLPNLVSYFSKILCDIYMPLYGTLLNYHALNATSATFNSTIKAINFRSEDVDQNSLTTFKLNSKYDFLLFQQANLINKNQDG